jgi:alkanesulfonate monooxygenase SsuD/methylene tetrahydromethanopterin reductase-like flavin-dependent oxidoreductase (luciferase family)
LSLVRRFLPDLSEEEMLATPAVFSGTPTDIADTIRGLRDKYGVTYITVQQQHGEEFAKVIAELR